MRIQTILIASAVALLAGCSAEDKAKTATPAEPAVAALPPGRPAIYAAAAEGPEPFVRALYAVYVAGGPKDTPPAPGQDPIYSRMMNATIGADVRVARGEVPTLNYDPICNCQDQDAFTLGSLAITQSGPKAADAAVVFTNMGETTRQTLKLVMEGPNWRVDDVVDAEGKSLAKALLEVITAAGG